MSRKPTSVKVLLYIAAILVGVWSIGPFIVLIMNSLSDLPSLAAQPAQFMSWPPSLYNFQHLFFAQAGDVKYAELSAQVGGRIWPGLINSLIVASGTTVLSLFFGSIAAYGYARYGKSRLANITLIGITVSRMIPGVALIIPWFAIFLQIPGMLDSKQGLIITYTTFTLPLVVWIMKTYFETLPRSLERAAAIDGCGRFQTFFRIILPLSVPGLIATGIISFIMAWNEFLYAVLLTKTPASQTITVALTGMASLARAYIPNLFPFVFAGIVVGVLPIIILAFIFQRYIVQGLVAGAVKG